MKIDKEKDEKEIYKAVFEQIAKQPTYQKNSTRNIQNNLMISSLTPLDLTQARVDSIQRTISMKDRKELLRLFISIF